MRMKTIAALVGVALAASAGPPAVATHETPPWPQRQRIYLMAADSDYTYWSVDAADPELSRSRLVQRCGTTESWRFTDPQKPCFSGRTIGGDNFYSTFFLPGSLFESNPSWNAADPLRFHLEMDVEALAEFDVSLVLQQGSLSFESPPATEVAPGIFEGALPTSPAPWGDYVNLFGVRVTTTSERMNLDLRLRGSSWLELPQPVGAKAVTDLIDEDTFAPDPTSFVTDTRGFTFNDAAWESWSFEGNLAEAETFDLELPRDAETLLAFIEVYDTTFVQDVIRKGEITPQKVPAEGGLRLLRGGEEVAHAAGPFVGQGTAALATLDLQGGPLTLEVDGADQPDGALDYRVHAVAVYGERTLASMRWRQLGDYTFRLPVIASCPSPYEPVPLTDEVRSWKVHLHTDTEAVGLPDWAIAFDLSTVGSVPCGEESGGDWVRFTIPGEGVWFVGATPAKHGNYVSAFDTAFDWEVQYTYSAPPIEHA